MTIRHASVLLPCSQLANFPTNLAGAGGAELLAAWTALWHPALLQATGRLPGWHPAGEPPDPASLDRELVLVPSISRERLPNDWCDRLRETAPRNPPPVAARASRCATVSTALRAAEIAPPPEADEIAPDFLALGYAHLQVELLTRSMHYATVLDTGQFTEAVLAASQSAISGQLPKARDELARAFDLLMDARNHVYAVDYYLVDVTLLARTTLGEPLRQKLATRFPTSVLATGELLDKMATEHPQTLAELRRAIEAGTACIIGGSYSGDPPGGRPPEAFLDDLLAWRETVRRHTGQDAFVFGQFSSAFSPLMPEVLCGCGFCGALHAAFDGGPLPRSDQRKTRWGPRGGPQIDALATTPLDVARPDTWLQLAERVADTIARDHVATVLIAGWPGQACEYSDDLRRAAQYGSLLGRPTSLDEYFRITREVDDWSTFNPDEYSAAVPTGGNANAISARVHEYRRDVADVRRRLVEGLEAVALPQPPNDPSRGDATTRIIVNPWNATAALYIGFDPLDNVPGTVEPPIWFPEVPAYGFAVVDRSASPVATPVPLAEGRTLRNERLEVLISESTGGIQSIKSHGDRNTRASQRLVAHDELIARRFADAGNAEEQAPRLETQMIAERLAVTRSDALAGEITSSGRLVDASGELLASFTQAARVTRGLPLVIIDVVLELHRRLEGEPWDSYVASRLAWADEAAAIHRGIEWLARPASRMRIESPEWIELADSTGTVTCFGCGLPLHRLAGPTWLDTLLIVPGEEHRRFQLAIGIDIGYPTHTLLDVLTAGDARVAAWPVRPAAPTGWLLHVGAKNLLVTHVAPLAGQRRGILLRLLETAGRGAHTKLAAFRPFSAARTTDFLGQSTGVLSVVDGEVFLEVGPRRWLQVEAEW